jgi:hypothetical protein
MNTGNMSTIEFVGVVSGIISILSFVFAVWVWMSSDLKIKELQKVIQAIGDISSRAIWDLRSWESVGSHEVTRVASPLSSIRQLTTRYTPLRNNLSHDESVIELVDKGIVWSGDRLMHHLEMSKSTEEIWMVSPDLKPDASDEIIGRQVKKNIRAGKRYVYFYPEDLPHADAEITRVLVNIGFRRERGRRSNSVKFVAVERSVVNGIFTSGNTVLYFQSQQKSIPIRVYQEIVLSKGPVRGALWQEYPEEFGTMVVSTLERRVRPTSA